MPWVALHVHRAFVVANDLVHGCEAEPRSRRARRKKRLEQSSSYSFVETMSVVGDSQAYVAAGLELSVAHLQDLGRVLLLRAHAYMSAAFYRLRRIGAQIEHDLLQLRRLAHHGQIDRSVFDSKLDTGRQRGTEQRSRFVEQATHLYRPEMATTWPSKAENILDQIAPTLCCPPDLADMLRGLATWRQL